VRPLCFSKVNIAIKLFYYFARGIGGGVVMSTSVCVSVCLSVRSSSGGVTKCQKGGNFVFFPIDNALHSITFGTHTKTV